MEIKSYILNSYTTILPFAGINSVEKALLKNEYLVVINDDEKFQGILTPFDLIKRPHKIVIDCLTEKEHVSADETITSVFDKFKKNHCSALPVFKENEFIGIVEKHSIIDKLRIETNELYNRSVTSQNVKDSFLNNLSHEIRTPLNGVLGFLEIISKLDKEDIKTKGEEYSNIVKKSADRFLLIMNDLIDLALINFGDDIEVERENVSVETIFSDLKAYFKTTTLLYNRNISIHYKNPDSSFVFFSDSKKIKHILYHLIDNAIKFSNNNNKVMFGYEIENQNIVFYVTNSGTQITEDKKEKIFDAFEKKSIYNNELVAGLGIGLPLVKKLSELLGGKIDFVTNEIQTTFFCTIPIDKAGSPTASGVHA